MDLSDTQQRMQKALEFVKSDVSTIRTGRATPTLVENIVIDAYGGSAKMKVMELATITTPDPATLVIAPYDTSIIGDIRRDIVNANVGLTPVIDNNIIRISVPALTTERRQEYVKLLHRKLEDGRVKVRQIRHDEMTNFKRMAEDGELNEDDRERVETQLQEMTDKLMKEIEAVGEAKEKELMTV